MNIFNSSLCVSSSPDPRNRLYLYSVLVAACLICGAYFIGDLLITKEYKEQISQWHVQKIDTPENNTSDVCKNQCRPQGTDVLPEGIVVKTSNLNLRPLWDSAVKHEELKPPKSLLGLAVGIKQKEIVNRIVQKFLSCGFSVMLFHYDDVVDEWWDLEWNDSVIHISATNQTKWWFAKRFLHPDIVAEYEYIFLWDEDLEVENFHPQRYIDIIKREGLEISQPALDPTKSVVHHRLTARYQKSSVVHRRYYKLKGGGRCDDNSTAPPCTGWVEMMAPVFSKAAWRCVWHMIQNDLIHAWGLDKQLGYCAQGDRVQNVGVVDSEYIAHLGLPTLGVSESSKRRFEAQRFDNRPVRWQSYIEMQIFKKRWEEAVEADKCWVDLYTPLNESVR